MFTNAGPKWQLSIVLGYILSRAFYSAYCAKKQKLRPKRATMYHSKNKKILKCYNRN